MFSSSSIAIALIAAPVALAQFIGGGMIGSESVSSGSYYNSEVTTVPGYGNLGYGNLGYGNLGYGGAGYGGLFNGGLGYGGPAYGGFGYGSPGYGNLGYGNLGLGGLGYGFGRGVGIMGASTGGAAIIGPSGSIIVGPQSAGGLYL